MTAMPRMPAAPKMPKMPKGGANVIIPLIILGAVYAIGTFYFEAPRKTVILWMMIAGACWLLILGIQKLMAIRAAKKIEKQLREQAEAQLKAAGGESKSEVEALNQKFNEALQMLKASKMGKSALYTLPWYVIIGAPGSGKTTCIQESGLNFPSLGNNPGAAVRGVGGTRNCDWWFTDEAIFLDTAGRYTTEADDHDEWQSFLDMIKRTRSHNALNGAIVVVSVQDLIVMSEGDIQTYAQTIRDRLDELTNKLDVILPIYIVFSKCDLMAGFTETFERMSNSERERVWGFTLPYEKTPEVPWIQQFNLQYQVMADALTVHRVPVMASEPAHEKKEKVFLFPRQFALTNKPLDDFMAALFRPNPFQETSVLRGVYFTSATQKGTPIDQLADEGANQLAMLRTIPAVPQQVEEKKAYFIHDVFEKIIVPDQTLVRTSTRKLKRMNITRWSAAGIAGLVFGAWLIALVFSFFANSALIGGTRDSIKEINALLAENSKDPKVNLEALDRLRQQLTTLHEFNTKGAPTRYGFGLYEGDTIDDEARRVYLRWCRHLFLEPVQLTIERELKERRQKEGKTAGDFENFYDLHRAYRMLCGTLPRVVKVGDNDEENRKAARSLLRRMLFIYWKTVVNQNVPPQFSGREFRQQREDTAELQLDFFLDLIVRNDSNDVAEDWQIKQDLELVKANERELEGALWIPASYRQIKSQFAQDAGTVGPTDLISTREGRDRVDVPYTFSRMFTDDYYQTFIKQAIDDTADVLAKRFEELNINKPRNTIVEALTNSYVSEYQQEWRLVLDRTTIREFKDIDDAVRGVQQLAHPERSPLKTLVETVWARSKLATGVSGVPRIGPSDDNLEWLTEALAALNEFSTSLRDFATAGAPGAMFLRRNNEPEGFGYSLETDLVTEMAKKYGKAIEDVKLKIDGADQKYRDDLQKLFRSVFANARKAIAADAQREADKFWLTQVYEPFQNTFTYEDPDGIEDRVRYFPFCDDLHATGGRSPEGKRISMARGIALNTFADFFSPSKGRVIKVISLIESFRQISIGRDNLIELSETWKRTRDRALTISNTMFQNPDDRAKFATAFQVEFQRFNNIADVTLTVEKEVAQMSRLFPDSQGRQIARFRWIPEAQPIGAILEMRVVIPGSRDVNQKLNFGGRPWGFMRILKFAKRQRVDATTARYQIEFTVPIGGNQVTQVCTLVVYAHLPDGGTNPFQPDLFYTFHVPQKVGEDE